MVSKNTGGSACDTLTRRGFITGVGGATAGALVAAMGTAKAGEIAAPQQVDGAADAAGAGQAFPAMVPSIGHVEFNPDLCAGCRVCEAVCSLAHFDLVNTEYSAIRINTDVLGGYVSDAETCKQCPGAECVAICPTGALHVDETTGARVIDSTQCIGCESCVNACPCDSPRPHYLEDLGYTFKCDLCGGDPWCVKCCSGGALSCSWVEQEADPTVIQTDTGIVVDYDLSGSIYVIAPDSLSVSGVYTKVDGNKVLVGAHVASTYTQPFTCKVKTTYFDQAGESIYASERIEFEIDVAGEGDFEDVYEADDPAAVGSIRLEIMCGKIAG